MLAGKCWRKSVRLAALARHTIVAVATIKPVPGQGRAKVERSWVIVKYLI